MADPTFRPAAASEAGAIASLVEATFTASEGAEEGRRVVGLVRDLMAGTPPEDLRVFVAVAGRALVGAILFTRLRFADSSHTVFLLSPVAVATGSQRRGIGQGLLRFGLDALAGQGVAAAVTYGDPDYYARVGFRRLTEAEAAPPRPLSHPEGWLGRDLGPTSVFPIEGASMAAPAFEDPALW